LTKKSASLLMNVQRKCGTVTTATSSQILALIRAELLLKAASPDTLFKDLAKGEGKIATEAFRSYVESLLGENCITDQVKLLCRQFDEGGISQRKFKSLVEQYFCVVKGIAMTSDFQIDKAKTLRKAEVDELMELLEGPKVDVGSSVQRVKAKALLDGVEGWITLKGNQGTPFLKEVPKPFYSTRAQIALDSEFKSEGDAGRLRFVEPDELLELVEGPKKETFSPGLRVKGKGTDGALGWFTVKDKTGAIFAEADGKYYVTTSSVAITDVKDVKDCKVLRKLASGELFTVLEGPVEEESGIVRVKGQTVKDELIGWVTIKGNAGTVFAQASAKHYRVLKDIPLTKHFSSSNPGEEVRMLAKGEAMQVMEGPREEKFEAASRAKVKAVNDGVSGWITVQREYLKNWTPFYKCKVAAPVHESISLDGAVELRQATVGEAFELLEGPTVDGDILRMRARAEKDGATGWVTIKNGEGTRFFD